MALVIHPNGVGDVHVCSGVKTGDAWNEVLVIVVEVIHAVTFGADGGEDLVKRVATSAIGQHAAEDRNAERRKEDIFRFSLVGVCLLEQIERELVLMHVYGFVLW